jgi:hypothetical protein
MVEREVIDMSTGTDQPLNVQASSSSAHTKHQAGGVPAPFSAEIGFRLRGYLHCLNIRHFILSLNFREQLLILALLLLPWHVFRGAELGYNLPVCYLLMPGVAR